MTMDSPDVGADVHPEAPRALRRVAEAGKKALAENEALRRELALLRAGVDPSTVVGDLFVKAYDGDLTPEAIKSAWGKAIGEVRPFETPDAEIPPEVRESTALRQALANNAPADVPVNAANRHPSFNMQDAYETALSGGASEETARAAGIEELIRAAARGDRRAIAPKDPTTL